MFIDLQLKDIFHPSLLPGNKPLSISRCLDFDWFVQGSISPVYIPIGSRRPPIPAPFIPIG
jgi:hypothetical protein